MDETQPKLDFEGWWWLALAIAVPPALVLIASSLLLSGYGDPIEPLARPLQLNGHAEAAARITLLAMSLGLTALGLACIGYFGFHLWQFRSRAFWALAGLALASSGVGAVLVSKGFPEEAQQFLGVGMVKVSLRAAPDCPLERGTPLARYATGPVPVKCTNSRYEMLREINGLQRLLLSFVSGALIFGTIACAAAPAIPNKVSAKAQMDRLNTYLYLSAAVLVTGLLFLSALLRWPGHAVHKDVLASFNQHVGAIVLYWGVTYSAFIAAYYVPVALCLSRRWRDVPKDESDKLVILSPLDLLKVGAAIFSPVITGLIGTVIASKPG
jgi:hypothetical protein